MRRFALCCLLGLSLAVPAGIGARAAQLAIPQRTHFDEAERATLDRISTMLNAIHSLKAGFVQIGPNGEIEQGDFYLQKPGRMRFEYRPPDPVLIVANDGKVVVKNARLNTLDSYSVSDTPLGLLLGDNVDLKTNLAITGVGHESGAILLHARSSGNRAQGDITLVFAEANLELRQWSVRDNQGLTTTVALRQVQTNVPLAETLFAFPQKDTAVKKTSK